MRKILIIWSETKIEDGMQGGTAGSHGLAKVRENRQADHHWVMCFRGPEQRLILNSIL